MSMATSWRSYDKKNEEMVEKFLKVGVICSRKVEKAFLNVSRAAFVSKELLQDAFKDAPIRGFPHIHMSAPHMYASILEDLDIEPGMSFLNIGSGTGYFSCLVGFLLKKHGINHGIEIHGGLVEFCRLKVQEFLLHGPSQVKNTCAPVFICGNCFRLDPKQLKYDRIYCGAACSKTALTFFLDFLKVGGFLIAPVGTKLVKVERVSKTEGVKTVMSHVCFAPLTRLDARVTALLHNGILDYLRYPVSAKMEQKKKTIYVNANFPVSKSPARRKLSRLRAIQDALDCLEHMEVPVAFCFVPKLDKARYEFVTGVCNKESKYQQINERSPDNKPLCAESEFDVWEHLCTDKLWLTVVDFYYSVCASDENRRRSCFHLMQVLNTEKSEDTTSISPWKFKKARKKPTQDISPWKVQLSSEELLHKQVNSCLTDLLKTVCDGDSENAKTLSDEKTWHDVSPKQKQKKITSKRVEHDCGLMGKLMNVPCSSWSKEHDVQLITFLSTCRKTSGPNLGDYIPKIVKPEMFENGKKLMKYQLISTISSDLLALRSIALLRICHVVDSVLDILAGLSLKKEQFSHHAEELYPLPSFTKGSFKSSIDDKSDSTLRESENHRGDDHNLFCHLTGKVHKAESQSVYRYQPGSILPRCRHLLPLSKRRHLFVKEILRLSESGRPRHVPVVTVERNVPVSERQFGCSVFMQIYLGLKKDLDYRWNKKSHSQWWEVKFLGEGIIDQGGGFRDSLTEIAEELCPSSCDVSSPLDLFVRTPNHRSEMGDCLDCYTFKPRCTQYNLYHWLGQLMGACFRSDETLPLYLAPYIWKLLVGECVTWKDDFVTVDAAAVNNIDNLEKLNDEDFLRMNLEQSFTTMLSDKSERELIEGGRARNVDVNNRREFTRLVRRARMLESIQQVEAVRKGLLSVLPENVLACLTWRNLERAVCGDPKFPIADMKANCRYGDNLKVYSQCVVLLWEALRGFTHEERSLFVRFITGRKRLPSPFVISRSTSSKNSLPSASTCGSNLFLPEYTSQQICTEKLRYAIYNCVAIDTDTSPW